MSLSPAIRKVLVPALLPVFGAGMLILPIASFAQKPAGQPTGQQQAVHKTVATEHHHPCVDPDQDVNVERRKNSDEQQALRSEAGARIRVSDRKREHQADDGDENGGEREAWASEETFWQGKLLLLYCLGAGHGFCLAFPCCYTSHDPSHVP